MAPRPARSPKSPIPAPVPIRGARDGLSADGGRLGPTEIESRQPRWLGSGRAGDAPARMIGVAKADEIEGVLADWKRGSAELAAETELRLRAILDIPGVEHNPWKPLKMAAGELGKTDKVVRARAIRDFAYKKIGSRIFINMEKLSLKLCRPSSAHEGNSGEK